MKKVIIAAAIVFSTIVSASAADFKGDKKDVVRQMLKAIKKT